VAFFVLQPNVSSTFQAQFASFFSTSAQVLAAGLIALVLELRAFTAPQALVSRYAAVLAILFIIIGEVASITALSPSLPDLVLYRWALALTVGAGVAFLFVLLIIATRTLAGSAARREREELEDLADAGDRMAARLLNRPAESA
jgi:hypothetical protein